MKKLKNFIKVLFVLFIFGLSIILSVNLFVFSEGREQIVLPYDAINLNDVDCILVLGAGLKNGGPSDMLQERLDTAISLYKENSELKLLMSGDHSRKDYDEVNVMKRYAVLNDVPSTNIFMDHAGISTYDSLKRAKDIFHVKKVIIVTQDYHLSRALYIAKSLGIEAYGVDARKKTYPGQNMRELREVLARNKDFIMSIFKPNPTMMGNSISLEGDGNKTNDKYVILTDKYTNEESFSGSSFVVDKILKLVNTNDYHDEKCDGISKYIMNVNGNKYEIEMYDGEIHIILAEKEKILNKEDAEVILNLIS